MTDEVVQVWHQGQALELPRSQCLFIDRSRINLRQACPYKRWLQYHAGPEGRGLVPARQNEDLLLGSAVHAGLEHMLQLEGEVERASEIAYNHFVREARKGIEIRGLLAEALPEVAEELIEEQAWLAYGLVWGFGKRKLQGLLEEYEVVAVEPEINWGLDQACLGNPLTANQDSFKVVVMMSRPDAILRHRTLDRLWTVSWKTLKEFRADTLEKLRCDTQTLTEGMATYHRFGEEPAGTYYGHFVKSKKEVDKESGFKRYKSPLVRPYYKEVGMGTVGADSFRGAWDWFDGEKTRRLGTGWGRTNVWHHMEMVDWLEMLDRGDVQPEAGRDWLGEHIIEPTPQPFRRDLAERWVAATVQEELAFVATDPQLLARCAGSCYSYNTRCTAFELCWGSTTIEDKLNAGHWVSREANHADEFGGEEE